MCIPCHAIPHLPLPSSVVVVNGLLGQAPGSRQLAQELSSASRTTAVTAIAVSQHWEDGNQKSIRPPFGWS